MVNGWPSEHNYNHLKREVLINLIEEREEFSPRLQHHLDKQLLSYKDAVLEIHARDKDEPIPDALGDFILAAISLTIKLPIFVIYPTVDKETDEGTGRTVTKNFAHVEYLFKKDANKAKARTPDLLVVVYNGIDYYAPTAPKEVAKMTRNCTSASTNLEDAMDMISKIVTDLPPSDARGALCKSLKFMGAAQSLLEGTSLATGTTAASLPTDVPIPKPSGASVVAKSAHRRAASTLSQPPPERKDKETDDDFAKRKQNYKDTVSKVAARDTKLGENQCPCGLSFANIDQVNQHQDNLHPDPSSWKCAKCPWVFNSKGHCWSHARKHLGKFYHYCDCKYKDPKDKDEKGKPKEKICQKGFDEELNLAFHRETWHNVGRCPCRCKYCDKPQQSNRRMLEHLIICDQGPNKDGQPTHWCKQPNCGYSCRGTSTLKNHMKTTHHEELGLPAPKVWKCKHCGKELRSLTGFKGHDCLTKKVRKPRKRKNPMPIIGNYICYSI